MPTQSIKHKAKKKDSIATSAKTQVQLSGGGGGRQSKRNMSRHCNALITQDHTPMDAACWNLKTHNSLLQSYCVTFEKSE